MEVSRARSASARERKERRVGGPRRWDARFRPSLPRGTEAVISVVLAAVLSAIDISTGGITDLAFFYFIPIFIASWGEGLWLGCLLAIGSVAANHFSEDVAPGRSSYAFYLDVQHSLMFLAVAWLAWMIKRQGDRLEREHVRLQRAQSRTRADLEAAHRVQESLMRHTLPEIPGMTAAMAYRFARQVGGDLLDVRRRGARVAVCVADVSGKGAQAALLAVAVKGWLDHVPGRFVSPVEVAEYLNRRVSECAPEEMFVTLAYLVLNTTTGECRCVIAGHESPLIRRSGGTITQELGPTGPALGLLAEARYEEVAFRIEVDDLLLCYTDGLTTARLSGGGRTGLGRTMELLRGFDGVDLNCLVGQMLLSTVESGGEPDDDVAILALRRLPAAARTTGSGVLAATAADP